MFKPVVDGAREVWVCKDFDACSQRHEHKRLADLLKSGCSEVMVNAFGHYLVQSLSL